MNNSYLMHHGIKGQKWGVRRYQNEDGSYTEEGKRRKAKELANKLAKNKYDKGASLKEKYDRGTLKPVLDSIPAETIRAISSARANMKKVIAANSYDADAFDEEVYASLDKKWSEYNRRARAEFIKREGYDPGDSDLWQDAYDLAEQDALKRHPEVQKKEDAIFEAVSGYQRHCESLANSILGQYGTEEVKSKNRWSQSTVNDAIRDAFSLIELHPEIENALLNKKG